MTKRLLVVAGILALILVRSESTAAPGASAKKISDVVISDRPYVRHDGGTDPAIEACNNDDPSVGGANVQANEPSVAIKPGETNFIVAGANDYCSFLRGYTWQGLYVSRDGGATWTDSLVPGYRDDTSLEGQASPTFGRNAEGSDSVLDWDNDGNLYYGFIALNGTKPNYGDVLVSTFRRHSATPLGLDYLRTVRVDTGTPGGFFTGHFNDKPAIKVDDWTGSRYEGNVYYAYDLIPPGWSTNQTLFSRSTDGGQTFSKPIKLNSTRTNPAAPDVAVAPDGTIYVFWRQQSYPQQNPSVRDAMVFVKSTDGGQTFTKQQTITLINPYHLIDTAPSGDLVRDCGDGPDECVSGFVFARGDSFPQATVDGAGRVFLTWEDVTPAPDDGDTYHPDGQSRAVVTSSSNGGSTWSVPVAVDPQPVGHQFWPNIEVDHLTGQLALIYMDSRTDPSYSVHRPVGNVANGTSVCGVPVGSAVCELLNAYIATSVDGLNWSSTRASSLGHQPQYEAFDGRRVPFNGDYLGIDAVGGIVFGAWTDNRDIVPGTDPREAVPDGFDVLQCRATPSDPDTCRNAGGLNQNIYGASLP